jgi:hypothetical protein
MTAYRIFFRDDQNRICGREDFDADSDTTAACIGQALRDACSDTSETFELWNGQKIIKAPGASVGHAELNERHQEIVLHTEEIIRHSTWLIAESHRLVDLVDGKKR